MTVNLPSTNSPDFVATLTQAATAFQAKMGTSQRDSVDATPGGDRPANDNQLQQKRPTSSVLVNALLQTEKAAKQQRQHYPLESLLGCWRLCFTTAGKAYLQEGRVSGKGFYVPHFAAAQISFSHAAPAGEPQSCKATIGNQVQLGPLLFRLTGPTRYLGQKNLLAFDFTQMQLSLFGKPIYRGRFRGGKAQAQDFGSQPVPKLPFFTFFLITENFIAARGRGGGVAFWVRESC